MRRACSVAVCVLPRQERARANSHSRRRGECCGFCRFPGECERARCGVFDSGPTNLWLRAELMGRGLETGRGSIASTRNRTARLLTRTFLGLKGSAQTLWGWERTPCSEEVTLLGWFRNSPREYRRHRRHRPFVPIAAAFVEKGVLHFATCFVLSDIKIAFMVKQNVLAF